MATLPDASESQTALRTTTKDSTGPAQRARSRKLLLVLLLVMGLSSAGAIAWALASDIGGPDPTLVFYTVKRADLPITVTESGSLQSQRKTELRCKVENWAHERGGTQILYVVPNGETVNEGDLLVELDSAVIQERLDEHILRVEEARSRAIQADVRFANQETQNETDLAEAQLKVDLAELAVQQYEDEEGGTFQLDLQLVDLQIQTAEANRLIKATDLKGIEMLRKLGYRSKGDLEQARLAALSADREVATAVSSRKELVDYTYRKNKIELAGAVKSAERSLIQVERNNEAQLAEAKAEKNEADLLLAKQEQRLEKYKSQLEDCKIYAPHDGMATYAIERDRRTHISEGATVRERQRIISLPDLSAMEVKTSVHESVLDWIHEGLPATVVVEAFQEHKYKATVKSVAVLADPGDWHSSDVKVYTTIVTIDESVDRLRPGMSAVVEIHVERLKDVLSVPVQAIVQVADESWVYIDAGGSVELQPITIGKTNEKFVEIREGLNEGDRVVLNPMSLVEESEEGGQEISPEGPGSDSEDESPGEQGSAAPDSSS